MSHRTLRRTGLVVGLGLGLAGLVAAGTPAFGAPTAAKKLPTVTMMVGGIDKQIYLPYQLAQGLGLYKKYGVDMQLSTEVNGGVGAEDAMASGQVDMAGAWYTHTIDFQTKGKDVVDIVQLSGAPGEREMCATGSSVKTAGDWKGQSVGVTDLGSGTDDLTLYMASKAGLTTQDFTRVGVGAGSTFVAALQHQKIVCGMTTQPTVSAIEKQNIGYSMIDLSSTAGAVKWLGGAYPAASVLVLKSWLDTHQAVAQKVVNALVATMHFIATHNASAIAAHLPPDFVSNALVTRADYVAALNQDKGQFLPNGLMPKSGPTTVLNILKFAGKVTGPVSLGKTYTNKYVLKALKLEHLKA